MVHQCKHLIIFLIIGTMHLSPGADEDALENVDAVGVPIHDSGCLGHMGKDLLQIVWFPASGVPFPVVEEPQDQLSSGGLPC